jgi:pyrroloquinoline quinone biosynthesis protein B
LSPAYVRRRRLDLEHPREIAGGLSVLPFAVPGKVALYLEQGEPAVGAETEDTIGLEVRAPGGAAFHFVPGCARMTPGLAARLDGAKLVFFDGTLWTDDEMIRTKTGIKRGARMGHMSVSGPAGSLAAFARLRVERKIFIHINNTNAILLEDSSERAAVAAAGWEVGYDGLEVEL